MVRAIDIQNVVSNSQFVTREQQLAQQQANFAPSQAALEAQRQEDIKKEQVRQSHQPEQEHKTIDPNRRQATVRRRWRRGSARPSPTDGEEEATVKKREESDEKGNLIDIEA